MLKTKTEAARLYTEDNCANQREFVEKALRLCAAGKISAAQGDPRAALL